MLRILFLTIWMVVLVSKGVGQQDYAWGSVSLEVALEDLPDLGINIDHVVERKGNMELVLSDRDQLKLDEAGLAYEILVPNLSEFYEKRNENFASFDVMASGDCESSGDPLAKYQVPQNFSLGSMGGYFTYEEYLGHLDTMAAKYPSLITQKQQIGSLTTYEGRPLYWVRLSDNPNQHESEPELLYTALHHAREPASLSQLIFFMYYVLENYETDTVIRYMVEETQMYFAPMINPDGYVQNQTTNPNGGGMWRKNRRPVGGGTFGIDLNRNYAYEWGGIGASADSTSDTYRGPSAFSEAETQTMKYFAEQHEFLFALNYHTFSDLLLYPYGFDYNEPTPDHDYYKAITAYMVRENGYADIIGSELYPASGDSDDWFYGEQSTKNEVYAMTPEVGSSDEGFWPPSGNIITLCKENVHANITAALLTGPLAVAGSNAGGMVDELNGHVNYTLKQLGLDTTGSYTVSLVGISQEILQTGAANQYAGLGVLSEASDSLSYSLDPNIQSGTTVTFVLSVNNTFYTLRDTISLTYLDQAPYLVDPGDTMLYWESVTWETTNGSYYSASSSITDSKTGDYNNKDNTVIALKEPLDLSTNTGALATFFAKWDIEAGYDFVQFQASVDGSNWEPLCGLYTSEGTANQDAGQPVYDGEQLSWVEEIVDLSAYAGSSTVLLRFILESDNFETGDGYYFDDFTVTLYSDPVVVAVDLIDKTSAILVYPNPAHDAFVIDIGINNSGSWRLMTVSGVLVARDRFESQAPISVASISPGLYLLQVSDSEGKLSTTKLSVK